MKYTSITSTNEVLIEMLTSIFSEVSSLLSSWTVDSMAFPGAFSAPPLSSLLFSVVSTLVPIFSISTNARPNYKLNAEASKSPAGQFKTHNASWLRSQLTKSQNPQAQTKCQPKMHKQNNAVDKHRHNCESHF